MSQIRRYRENKGSNRSLTWSLMNHQRYALPLVVLNASNGWRHVQVGAVGVCSHGRIIPSVVRDHKVHLGCAQEKQDGAVDQSQQSWLQAKARRDLHRGCAAPWPPVKIPLGQPKVTYLNPTFLSSPHWFIFSERNTIWEHFLAF